jgi:two-component system KDP operon response regulator KdpE
MPATLRFLVVDDERQIRRAVAHVLEPLHGVVREAATGREALTLAAAESPSLVVLDLGLPDIDGTEVCRELRGWSDAAILVLTARHEEQATLAALDAGADDYVTKPFSPPERTVITAGPLRIDLAARTVERHSALVHLTPTEYELLSTLARNAGRVMTHSQLFSEVWKGRIFGDAQAHLRVHVAHLRRKLEDDPVRPRHLQTALGVGYRFVLDAGDP